MPSILFTNYILHLDIRFLVLHYIQGVHKVSLQFKNFITKANGEILLLNLFNVLSGYQSF